MNKQLEDEESRVTAEDGFPKALHAECCHTCDILELLSIHKLYPFDALCPCQAESGAGVP